MRCFEIRKEEVVAGLLVQRGEKPCVHVTTGGEFYLTLSDELEEFIARKVPDIAPLRLYRAQIEGDRLASDKGHAEKDRMALVLLGIEGGEDGAALLTSCGFREWRRGKEIAKDYSPFPSLGVRVLGQVSTPPEWVTGAPRLEVALVMEPKSAFRIFRTGRLRGESPETFVRWDGWKLTSRTPGRNQQPRRAQVPQALSA